MPRPSGLRVAAALALAVSALVACGPDTSNPSTAPQSATSTAAAPSAPAATVAAGPTPEQLCGTVTIAAMAGIAGFPITETKPEWSGDVAVCHYIGTIDNFTASKIIMTYQPHGKTAVEYTKAKGEVISGLGELAIWFKTSASLSVELGGDAVLGIAVIDVRFHHSDPRGGARQIADIAVGALAHAS